LKGRELKQGGLMKKILLIDSSPRGEMSYTRKLSQAVIEKIKKKYPNSTVIHRDLTTSPLPHVDPFHLNAFFNSPEQHTEDDKRAIRDSNEIIRDLLHSDTLVIGIPMWNFSIPSVLKAWIDHLARAGKTFRYTPSGPEGLVTGKKVYLAIGSGGVYSEGPAKNMDFVEPYMRAILGFLGMKDVSVIRVEGVAMPDLQDKALDKAVASIEIE
jgi:FMN-dependent NADH-azoreductase